MNEYMKSRQEHISKGRPLKEKKVYKLKQVSDKLAAKRAEEKATGGDNSLDLWFQKKMDESEPVCAECGMRADWLLEPQIDPKKAEAYRLMWRACQAHILPKKKNHGFPSICTNEFNHIILFPSWGGFLCGCHGFYDSNWYNASTMKIWKSVLQTMKEKLIPAISESEKKNIPEAILKELK